MNFKPKNSSLLGNQNPVKRKPKSQFLNCSVSSEKRIESPKLEKKLKRVKLESIKIPFDFKYFNAIGNKLPSFIDQLHLSDKIKSFGAFFVVIAALISKVGSQIFGSSFSFLIEYSSCLARFIGRFLISIFRKLAMSVAALVGGMCATLKFFTRFAFVLLARWMKIHGSHGVPPVGIRRLRMVIVVVAMVLMGSGVVARLYALQGLQHGKWNKIANKQHGTGVEVEGARGLIVDRNGLKLAVSIPAVTLGVHPRWIKNKSEVTQKISTLLDLPYSLVEGKLNEDKSFTTIAKGISTAKKKDLEALKIHGLEIEEEFNRVYPQGDLAATIIGKAGKDGVGLSGVERSLNPSLTAPATKFAANRDARGRLMNSAVWAEDSKDSSPASVNFDKYSDLLVTDDLRKEGASIALTLDSTIQRFVEEEFDIAKETAKAKNVFGLMMDADTGEILAMGQTSRYNPNESKSISPEALRNVVLQNSFEPGSTFKPIVAALALEQGVTSKNELIDCENGRLSIGRRTIKDAHPVPTVTFEQVLVRSSNIGMAKLGFRMGKEKLYDSLYRFGFGQKSGLELSGESSGIMRNHKSWAQVDIATHSFGQGVSVTALQMVRAYGALANGGILLTPTILKNSVSASKGERLISEKTASVIKEALYLVTEDEHGTGKNSRISGVPVYGKTGTAQKARVNGRGYDSDKILASFIGFVDGKVIGVNRTLVFYVAVDEPGVRPRWGGTLAAPVFKTVMERTLSYLLSQRITDGEGQYVQNQISLRKPLS